MLRRRLYLGLLLCAAVTTAFAGSFEDFFSAIRRDDAGELQSILQRGFDPNTTDDKGRYGLLLAFVQPSPKAAAVLIAWPQTKVEVRNSNDESPLMLAALNGQIELVRTLIERDADVNKTGWTPLHYAVTHGHLEIMRLLLDNAAYIDAASPNGTTPLMMAAAYGTPQAVQLLLDEGADPRLKNQLGLTALDFATKYQRPDATQMLSQLLAVPAAEAPAVNSPQSKP